MLRNSGILLLAGIAALAYYQYNRLTEEEKRKMVQRLKGEGEKLMDRVMPTNARATYISRSNGEIANKAGNDPRNEQI